LFKTLRSVAMRSYSHLSEDERDQIGVLRAAGRSMGAIARALGRAKATISRELQRNALPLGGYPFAFSQAGEGVVRDLRLIEQLAITDPVSLLNVEYRTGDGGPIS
jgi:IS30 family transposase